MISSAWDLQLFISPTQAMGSLDFSSSVAPAVCAREGIIRSSISLA